MKAIFPGFLLATLFAMTGCATVDPTDDYARVHELVESSTGYADVFDPNAELLTDEQINAILADGLTVDEAVRLALLNNRTLQAEFAGIGVAKADWVQSGLLRNPTLGMEVLLPEGGGRSQIAATIAQNIVDLWQLPVRKQVAQHELDAAVLRVARIAGELSIDTRRQYYEAIAATELMQLAEQSVELYERSHKAIGDKRDAGTASAFDENLANGQWLNGQLDLKSAQLEAANAKRRLARTLSLQSDGNDLNLIDAIPEATIPADFNADTMIESARQSRLDLRSYEAILKAAGIEMQLEKGKAFGEVEAGVGFERTERRGGEGNGIDEMVGPIITLELPIFDQNQAQVARRLYLERAALKNYEQAIIAIAQDVRIAGSSARTAFQSVQFYKDKLLPQAEQNLQYAEAGYQAGQLTILGLIESQRSTLQARQAYIRSRTNAVLENLELERVLGKVP